MHPTPAESPASAPAPRFDWRTIAVAAAIFWLFPLLGALAGRFVDDLIVIYVAILLACCMHPIVSKLHAWRIPRSAGVLLIFLCLAGVVGLVAFLAIPLFTLEAGHLIDQWPHYQAQLNGPLGRLGIHLGGKNGGPVAPASGMIGALPTIVVNASALLVNIAIILVLGFFFTSDRHFAERLVAVLVPPRHRQRTDEILAEIGTRMGRWVLGQLGIVVYYAAAFALGLTILGIPFAFSVAVVTGLLEIIPFVGGFVGLALALVVTLGHNPALLIPVVILYLIVTNVEAHIIVPNLYGKAVQLHPATVVIALLLGATAFGIVGALIAMPLAAGLQVLVERLYVEDVIRPAEEREDRLPAFRIGPAGVVRWPRRRVPTPTPGRPPAEQPPVSSTPSQS